MESRWAYSGWSVLAFGRASCDQGAGVFVLCIGLLFGGGSSGMVNG